MNPTAYANPDVLVSTDWVAEHTSDPSIRVIESNEDVLLYDTGHVAGAVHIDWQTDLNDPLVRDYISPEEFAKLASRFGITPETTCEIRAFAEEALAQSKAGKPLIDVRSPGEYKGTVTHMPEYPQEGVLRGGHIPGAKSVPWKTAVNEDGTFRTPEELAKIYTENCGLQKGQEIIAYCRIGERSSHTWFVLTYLLGYPNVRNYDGSWTEWGNRVRMPIERSA
jgi:thiosulfate/3-mercaptopyruvate sulfurtransferase